LRVFDFAPTPVELEMTELQRTPLFAWHVANGGRMVDFAGWELPVFYEGGAIDEHHATRMSVGLFDIDHMGQVEVRGPEAISVVDRLVTSDMTTLPLHHAKYGLLCREDGGVIDDVIVYRTDESTMLVVVNASNRPTDLAWIEQHADGHDVVVTDRSDALEMIAIQGPNAVELVDLAAGGGVSSIERFTSGRIELFGASALVGRTGYTGEDGVELYVEGGVTEVWAGLLDLASERGVDAMAIGLGARDSLRFEPGYPLYGHELGLEINPFEARLSWAVDLVAQDRTPSNFIGAAALRQIKEAGNTRRLETLVMVDKGVPRDGSTVIDADGNELGPVVSGMFAPTADVFAANAFLPRTHGVVGNQLAIDIRGKAKAAVVTKRPLYRLP
jgi:aminomethyltransferase